MTVVTVLGARPQFIKASAVSHAVAKSAEISEILVHTGQHFDEAMSDVFFSDLGIAAPAYNLGIQGGGHGEMTGRMLIEIERVLVKEKPDLVLVYGDTNSTLAGALAAVKLHIPVAHVEAGLRSFNRAMPEEVNRVLTDHISRWLFTPTAAADQNLEREGIASDHVLRVGDVMYDVALRNAERVSGDLSVLLEHGLQPGQYVLATIHRAENTDDVARLAAIVEAFAIVAEQVPVVWPLHPRTRTALQKIGRLGALADRLTILEPVSYLQMLQLETHAAVIATDSGGVQKEAFFYRVPCVTIRDETEWTELVDAGWNRLAPPTDSESVAAAMSAALGSEGAAINPYGDGDAAERMVSHLLGTR